MSRKNQMQEKAKDFMNQKMMKVPDQDVKIWNMLIDVPKVNQILAVLFCLINVILPGWGTMFAACATQSTPEVSKTQLALGLVQFLTAAFLIGWIASIYWGYLIVMKAFND